MIHIDTSILVDALTGPRHAGSAFRQVIAEGTTLRVSAIALFEWFRGPRRHEELEDQERLFPTGTIVVFGVAEAARAATIYRRLARARGREADIAIAATAIVHDAALWTSNPGDFRDIPDLTLFTPPAS